MRFRIITLVARHASGRVSVVPKGLRSLSLHAVALEPALEELTLALDDMISRTHPRLMASFPHGPAFRPLGLAPKSLPVWTPQGRNLQPLAFAAVLTAVHAGFAEVWVPRLDWRAWVKDDEHAATTAERLLEAHLEAQGDHSLLGLRSDGSELFQHVEVSAEPVRLSDIGAKDLHRERLPDPQDDDDPELPDADTDEESHTAAPSDEDGPPEDLPEEKWTARVRRRFATPLLEAKGVALHRLALEGTLERAFHVDALVHSLRNMMVAERPEPVVIVGRAGVGKTALVDELACALTAERQASGRRVRPFFRLDGPRLIAGGGMLGGWQGDTLRAFAEAERSRVLLDLGTAEDLLHAGKSAHSEENVSQLITPLLATRRISVVAEATPEAWSRVENINQSFARQWTVLRVEEPPPAQAERVLLAVAGRQGTRRKVVIDDEVVRLTLRLARRFWPYGSAVGTGAAFLRRVADAAAHAGTTRITENVAVGHFSSESGLPERLLRDDLPMPRAELQASMARAVMGQDEAVARAVEAVARIKAGLTDEHRPMAVLFFCGPTGVGKTELAKALCECVFSSRERLVRLDMGEYAGPDALERLLGTPESPGLLASSVRREPFCVVLLDEIEKAHPAVFDALLGVLGEGRLTDATGRFTDFRNAVIILTSNLGADTLRTTVGFGRSAEGGAEDADRRRHYRGEVERFFRPELFNRLDDVIVFSSLPPPVLHHVLDRELQAVPRREGLRRLGVRMEVGAVARSLLLKNGVDPRYGARPLKRALERDLVVPLASSLASHPNTRGAVLAAEADGERVVFTHLGDSRGAPDMTAQVEQLLADAAELRARLMKLQRSAVVTQLRERTALFDKASKHPAFWADHSAAEKQSQDATVAREIVEKLEHGSRQATAIEDVAFEAFYDRSADSLTSLRGDLVAVEAGLRPMAEELFAAMHPPRSPVRVVMTWSRGGAAQARQWVHAYRNAISCTDCQVLVVREVKTPAGRPGKPPRITQAPQWKRPDDRQPPPGDEALAVALTFGGTSARWLLRAEHGVHRVITNGNTFLLRILVDAVRAGAALPDLEEIEKAKPGAEVRRVDWDKHVIQDLRTRTGYPLVDGHPPPLADIWQAWLEQQLDVDEVALWN
ncbi:MAG: AAA family ATPase [Deltaproteobacteria bacterium]|nr:AAA family ATPase [Deltaproteobacteria bacterium]